MDEKTKQRTQKWATEKGIDFDSLTSLEQKQLTILMLSESLEMDHITLTGLPESVKEKLSVKTKPAEEPKNETKKKSLWDKIPDFVESITHSEFEYDSSFSKTCSHCFIQNTHDSNFCNKCGKKLNY